MNIIKFHSDTKHRKQFFSGLSFSHPAKMHLSLQLWLIENFTQPRETILDPMAGSGTILVACSMGRNVICIELEQKFVDMMKGNWAKIQQRGCQLGYSMGAATILQGDARNLTGILVDKIITSPPYANEAKGISQSEYNKKQAFINEARLNRGDIKGGIGRSGALGRSAINPDGYSKSQDNLGNLPYGSIDAVISSPPYEGTLTEQKPLSERTDKTAQLLRKARPNTYDKTGAGSGGHGYLGKVDAVISSPPYQNTEQTQKDLYSYAHNDGRKIRASPLPDLDNSITNIGNLKSDSYLQAMLQVYQQCYAVLKDGGLMVLVVKSFIRNKKVVDLAADTIRLCENAGFLFKDRWYRELATQSFWRTIYHQKYPDVEPIKHEDILVFRK